MVTTSFRNKSIGVHTDITSHLDKPGKFTVKATVLDAKEPGLELGRNELTLDPGKSQTLVFEKPWPDAHLWCPADPYLYVLQLDVTDADGKLVDRSYERFGFRESWIDGPNVMFNGQPMKVKGFTCGAVEGIACGDALLSRGTHGIVDYYDEFGYLASEALADITNTSSKHNVERDAFWQSAAVNVLAGAKRLQNHPSIIAWDISNEWLGFLGYGGGDPMLGGKRFKTLTNTLNKQDPTRWTFGNGDGDFQGLHDVFSTHYMYPQPSKEILDTYFPDYAFWRPLDKDFTPGQEVPITPNQGWEFRYGKKVLLGQRVPLEGRPADAAGLHAVRGRGGRVSPAIDSGSGPVAWFWKQLLDGHRDLGVFTVSYYATISSTTRRGWVLQTFIMPDVSHHGFAGQTLLRKFSLHNDVFQKAHFAPGLAAGRAGRRGVRQGPVRSRHDQRRPPAR